MTVRTVNMRYTPCLDSGPSDLSNAVKDMATMSWQVRNSLKQSGVDRGSWTASVVGEEREVA